MHLDIDKAEQIAGDALAGQLRGELPSGYWAEGTLGLVDEVRRLREALVLIRNTHRPLDADDRLCAEGCSGSWPCTTRLEADEALGNHR